MNSPDTCGGVITPDELEVDRLRREVSRLKHAAERMVWERKADLDAAEKCNAVSRAVIKQRDETAAKLDIALNDLAEAQTLLRARDAELEQVRKQLAVWTDPVAR